MIHQHATLLGPPFRADHVGSLLRPASLLAARAARDEGRLDASGLRLAEDEAIAEAVRLQEDLGFALATDGELRRRTWHMDFLYQLEGIEPGDEALRIDFRNSAGDVSFASAAPVVAAPVRLGETIFGKDFSYLSSVVTTAVPKLTIPSPSMLHYRAGTAAVTGSVYGDLDAFFADLALAYADELRRLHTLGCRYLQLDDTSLAYLNDPAQRALLEARGDDPVALHRRYIAVLNAALAGRPEDLTVTVHLCRGNYRSSWAAEGGYDYVAEDLFGGLDVDGFFLEYDDARSGDFSPLRFVRDDQRVVLGLVSSKRRALEDKDELKRRVDEASAFVPLDQLCLSPQCGFSSTVEGNELTVDDEIAKLRLVSETAAEIWG